jgi:hypothetical protein
MPEALPGARVASPYSAESFFLSAHWLDACRRTWAPHARFDSLNLGTGTETLGYVLMGRGSEVRHRLLKVCVLAVNESTVPALDEVTVEHNGIVECGPGQFSLAFEALIGRINRDPYWDELRFSGLSTTKAEAAISIAMRHGLRARLLKQRPTYWVDLDRVRREHGGDFASTISSNTRQQLRRAVRALERDLGRVSLVSPGSCNEALKWFDDMAPLHRRRWPSGKVPSGFDNELFVAFHRNLIAGAFDRGAIEMLRLDAGATTLAYLYNFRLDGCESFYLSAINYEQGERYKPGMLAHWMAIERALGSGQRVYDFLAGESPYKARLSTDQDVQQDWILWRPRWALRLEDTARGARRYLRRRWLPATPA